MSAAAGRRRDIYGLGSASQEFLGTRGVYAIEKENKNKSALVRETKHQSLVICMYSLRWYRVQLASRPRANSEGNVVSRFSQVGGDTTWVTRQDTQVPTYCLGMQAHNLRGTHPVALGRWTRSEAGIMNGVFSQQPSSLSVLSPPVPQTINLASTLRLTTRYISRCVFSLLQ